MISSTREFLTLSSSHCCNFIISDISSRMSLFRDRISFNSVSQYFIDLFLSSILSESRTIIMTCSCLKSFSSIAFDESFSLSFDFRAHTKSRLHISDLFCQFDLQRIFFDIRFFISSAFFSSRIQHVRELWILIWHCFAQDESLSRRYLSNRSLVTIVRRFSLMKTIRVDMKSKHVNVTTKSSTRH